MAPQPPTPAIDTAAAPAARVSAGLERSLTQVARAILRLEVPARRAARRGVDQPDRLLAAGRVSEPAPVRLSEIADSVELDLSTISRQIRDLVAAGLSAKVPDPADGRAALLSLTEQGMAVLEAVSEARRQVLAEAIADWTDEERNALAERAAPPRGRAPARSASRRRDGTDEHRRSTEGTR